MTNRPKDSSSPNSLKVPASGRYFAVGLCILLVIATVATFGILTAGYLNVEDFKKLGTWGDFAGGLLNPVLTFITFLALILTLWLQRQELSLTRDEMIRSANALELQAETLKMQAKTLKMQSFEKTFFEMLSLHNTIVEAIGRANPVTGLPTKGRDTFNLFYRVLKRKHGKKILENIDSAQGYTSLETAQVSYLEFWKLANTDLAHYFRFLFNFFRFIEKSGIDDPFYPKLLRSQLSDQELLILFYNNITERGKPFAKYAELYELFDNLPVERLLDKSHADFADKTSYGKNSFSLPE